MNYEKKPDMTVLVVEDDELLNKSIRRLLEREGFTSEGFLSGDKVLERVFASSNDVLLLLDYSLPDLTAKEIVQKVRAHGLEIPFVIVTGHGDEQLAVEMMKFGAMDYIVKSLQFHEVVPSKVRRACEEIANNRKLVRAEKGLKMAAAEWQKTFDSIADAVFILDSDQRIVRCNRATLLLLGKPVEEVIGMNCCKAIHGVDTPIAGCPIVQMKRSLNRESGEMDLGNLCYSITADPIIDAGNVLIGAVHVISDITERKQAEKNIQTLAKFPAENPSPVMRLDREGVILYANEASAPILYSWKCGPEMPVPEPIKKIIQEVFKNRVKRVSEIQIDTKTYLFTMAPFPEEGYINIYGVDITERKRAGEELRESKALFEAVVENVPLMIFLKEATDLRFVIFNRAGEDLLGYDRTTLLGKNNLDLFPPDQAANFMAKDREVLDGNAGMLDIPEEPILTAKKGQRLLHTRKVCIRGTDGTTKYLLGISEDITERKRAEEEKTKLEDQLRQSQKLEAIGQLAGGVAHDFNNLLGGIMGNAELIKMHSGKDPTIDRYSDVIVSSSAKAADLTRQLLTFARKVRVNFTKVNIHAGIENVIELLSHTIDKRIEIIKKFEAASELVLGDSNMLENALLNIAINARDAMPAGGTLSFTTDNVMLNEANKPRTVPELDIGAYVRVTIRDTGSGMDEKTLLRIFEPFFTTKEIGKGTGLGLAAVYGCVRQHNGHVVVESEPGKGSAFIIYLPVSYVNERQSGQVAQVCVKGKGNILIVDDEQAIGEIAVELLKGIGYTPTYINSAAKAIEYFKKNHGSVDAVILDIIMPKMNGLDVFRELKRLNPKVKVIIASGYSDEKQDALLKEEGVTVFVNKPYSLSELSTPLAGMLGGEK